MAMRLTITPVSDPLIAGPGWLESVDQLRLKNVLSYLKQQAGIMYADGLGASASIPKGDEKLKARTNGKYRTHYQHLKAWKDGATLQEDGRYVRRVRWKPPRGSEGEILSYTTHGRMYPTEALSLALLRKDIRGALAFDHYVDIDMVRAQPRLLARKCQEHKIEVPTLIKYACNYQTMEAEVTQLTGCPPEAPKRLVNVLLNGGGFKTWCEMYELDSKETVVPPLVEAISQDRAVVWKHLHTEKGSVIFKEFDKKRTRAARQTQHPLSVQTWNALGDHKIMKTGMNALMQHLERLAMEHVYGQFSPEERQLLIYSWDGVMMPRTLFEEKDGITFFDALSAPDGTACTGIAWKQKQFDNSLEAVASAKIDESTEGDVHVNLDYKLFDIVAAAKLETYIQRRDYWEHFFAKIDSEHAVAAVQWFTNPDGDLERRIRIVKTDAFVKEYPDLAKDAEQQEKQTGVPVQFVSYWLGRDTEKKRFANTTWIPFDGVYSPCQHSLYGAQCFNTFTGYNDNILAKEGVTKEARKNFTNWRKICTECVGGEEPMKTFIQLIATKVKNPTRKLDYGIIMRSRQGEGKDTTVTAIERVVGRQHVLRMQQMDSMKTLGGTGALVEKLFVQVNECDKSQMKGIQGSLKAWTTDAYIQVRKLYQDPTMAKCHGLWLFTSNKMHVLSADTDSGERRYFVFQGTGRFAPATGKPLETRVWADLHDGMKDPGFSYLMYEYLTEIYDPNFDFKKAKAENAKAEPYQRMMGAQRRDELFWLQDFMEGNSHIHCIRDSNQGLGSEDQGLKNPDEHTYDAGQLFHDHVTWKVPIRLSLKCLHNAFRQWGTMNSLAQAAHRTIKEFELNLCENLCLPFTVIACKKGGDQMLEFTPAALYFHMYKKYMMNPKEALIEELRNMAANQETTNLDDIPLTDTSTEEEEDWEEASAQ